MSIILGVGITSLVRSPRIEWQGEPLPDRAVIAFWHAKMIAGWWLARKDAVAIVSQSKDGQRLAGLLKRWKYSLVRGSSSKGGREALEQGIAKVRAGEVSRLVITPDGPRGPRQIMKRGAFIAAEELDLPLIFLQISYENAKVLTRSWDHFEVPYPFSKVVITARRVETSDFPEDREAQEAFLEDASLHFR